MKSSILKQASYRRLFITLAIGIFAMLSAILFAFGLVPQELATSGNGSNVSTDDRSTGPADSEEYATMVLPTRIVIASVGVDTNIEHPQSQNVDVLDEALLRGAVYYPGSGSLVQGNAFIFGHSTGLSVVRNQAYKAFNNLKNVVEGDEIRAYGSDGNIYIYSAVSTELVTEDSALVEFNTNTRMLTLSTCNTFGKKEERHVVKAVLVRVDANY